jgi:hypothetical protein
MFVIIDRWKRGMKKVLGRAAIYIEDRVINAKPTNFKQKLLNGGVKTVEMPLKQQKRQDHQM